MDWEPPASTGLENTVELGRYTKSHFIQVCPSIVGALGFGLGVLQFGPIPVLGLCTLLWSAFLLRSSPFCLVLLWLALPAIYLVSDANFLSIGRLGSIVLLPDDVVIFVSIASLTMITIARPSEMVGLFKANPFLGLFVLMVLLSVAWFTPTYGKMAIGEARKEYFFFLFPLLSVLLVRTMLDLCRLVTAVQSVAILVSLTCVIQFLRNPSIDRTAVPGGEGISLIALFALFTILASHANGVLAVNKSIDRLAMLLFLSVILLARTRTVLLAAGFGLVILFYLVPSKTRILGKALALLIPFTLAVGSAFWLKPSFAQEFVSPLEGILDPVSDHTASWRIEGWRQQIEALSETEVVFGKGLGSYFRWYYGTDVINYGPHNEYVELLLKFGLVGLSLYLVMAFRFFRSALNMRRRLPPGPLKACIEIGIVNFGAAHVQMTGYGFSLITFVFLGIGMAALSLAGKSGHTPAMLPDELSSASLAADSYARANSTAELFAKRYPPKVNAQLDLRTRG